MIEKRIIKLLIQEYGMAKILDDLIQNCVGEDDGGYLGQLRGDLKDAKHRYETRYKRRS